MGYRLRIGSRPSPLALVQANAIKQALENLAGGMAIEIVPISTSGDKMTTASLARIGGKGLFVRELEQALSDDADRYCGAFAERPAGGAAGAIFAWPRCSSARVPPIFS